MTRAYHWLFPHPLLTLLLAVVWVLLQNQFSWGMAVFGVILGIIITKITAVWWPERPGGIKVGKFFSYAIIVLWDIMVANVQVAWIVLTKPNSKLKPISNLSQKFLEKGTTINGVIHELVNFVFRNGVRRATFDRVGDKAS